MLRFDPFLVKHAACFALALAIVSGLCTLSIWVDYWKWDGLSKLDTSHSRWSISGVALASALVFVVCWVCLGRSFP